MPGITGQGTTFNLPNFVGELFTTSPEDTPFLSSIGGLTGGEGAKATLFGWTEYDRRPGEANRQRLEGADAPEATARVRKNVTNVVEIHQETVEVSYTKQAATSQISSNGPMLNIGDSYVPVSEIGFQLEQQFKQIAQDVENTFINGEMQVPTDNNTPRKTMGLLGAIKTNVVTSAQLTEESIGDLFQKVWENGGIQVSETRTVIVGADLKRKLTKVFIKDAGYKEDTRDVGGVSLKTFETDFGRANIMLSRYVPKNTLIVASLDKCKPVFLEIPGKGHFFAESLAKTGASDKIQIYGEIGLKYGLEQHHGKLTVTG